MRINTIFPILALAAGFAGTQPMMPIPAYGSTYSAAAVTRGFYFQAPRDFTIVGIRVPNEKNVFQAGMVVYVMSSPPPAWPRTRTGSSNFLYVGFVLASKVYACNMPVKTGEWVGILGACGDRTIVHNSYAAAAGPFPSDVVGVAATIRAFGTQTNVMAAQGQGPYYAEDTGFVSRVEVYVSVSPATLTGPPLVAPGTGAALDLSAPSDDGLPYQVGSAFGSGPIPLGNRQIGLSPDALLVLSVSGALPALFQDYTGVLDLNGRGRAVLNVPKSTALIGLRIHNAFVTLAPAAPFGVASISNSIHFEIR